MLSRVAVRSAARLAPLRGARFLCAPATEAPTVTEIKDAIAMMKEKMDAKPAEDTFYPEAKFKSDLASATVDMSLLSATLTEVGPEAKKLCMKSVSDATSMTKEVAEGKAMMESYDWGQWEAKGLDKDIIAEVKAILDKGIAEAAAGREARVADIVAKEKEVKAAFEGSDGFLEKASKRSVAAKAAMAAALAEMEKLELDAVGIKDVTIAEILEREPELRAEIEEEIRQNNWGY